MSTELEKIDPAILDDMDMEKFEEYRRRKKRVEDYQNRCGMSDDEFYLRALSAKMAMWQKSPGHCRGWKSAVVGE